MKVINVIGSPRSKGNSATAAQLLLDRLKAAGARIKTYELQKLKYHGCHGCLSCKTISEKCVVHDGLTKVLEDIRTADVVLLGAPIYCGEITAQLKGLTDRFYSFFGSDYMTNPNPGRLAAGKKLVFILSQGNPDEKAYADLISKYTRFFKRNGFSEVYPLQVAGFREDSDVRKNERIAKLVSETAQMLGA